MKTLTEKKLKSEKIFNGKLIELYRDQVQLPNGKTSTREWIDHPGAACIVPILDDGKICLVKQYRYCLLYTSPSPRDTALSRMPSSA